jgi:hypothetical protein
MADLKDEAAAAEKVSAGEKSSDVPRFEIKSECLHAL